MPIELVSDIRKARYYSSVILIYCITLLFGIYVFWPSSFKGQKTLSSNFLPAMVVDKSQLEKPILTGKPIRVVISSVGIDLPIDEGRYSEFDGTWSLSAYHAQFAMLSPLANDDNGNTFIYGHNNKYVFGPLKQISPGAEAQVYTDNNHIFNYVFDSTYAVSPDNTSVLNYQGPSILTIQTCSGSWNEKRQMYTFKFEKVL